MPHRPPLLPHIFAFLALTPGLAVAATAITASADPFNPDFSAHEKSYPWTLTPEFLAKTSIAQSKSNLYEEKVGNPVLPELLRLADGTRVTTTALWAGAQDTRYVLTCVSGAGDGGPSLARRNFGETLAAITTNFPHWFTPKYATYSGKTDMLPVDTHELIALVAPRGYHAGDATLDVHADPLGSWLALVEAERAWALFGLTKPVPREMPLVHTLYTNGPIADHMREGVHNLTAYNWKCFLDHADQFYGRR